MLRKLISAMLPALFAASALAAETGEEAGAAVEADPTAAKQVMVRVDITGIADELASALGVEAEALPRSVEVPIETASSACDMALDQLELFRAADQDLECNAASLSPELERAVAERIDK